MKLLATLLLAISTLAKADIKVEMTVNGKGPDKNGVLHMWAGAPAVWNLHFTDTDTGKPITDFEVGHAKLMHMVVMKNDLSSFAHIHPSLDLPMGIFTMPVNLPSSHPDNQGALTAVQKPGMYHVFAEIKSAKYDALTFRFDLAANGIGTFRQPVADKLNGQGQIVKYYSRLGKPTIAKGAFYRTTFWVDRLVGVDGVDLTMKMNLDVFTPKGYVPATQKQKWMMMGGHSILTTSEGKNRLLTKDVYMRHLHAMLPPDGKPYMLSFYYREPKRARLFKTWIQIKHNDRVLTLPFTWQYQP